MEIQSVAHLQAEIRELEGEIGDKQQRLEQLRARVAGQLLPEDRWWKATPSGDISGENLQKIIDAIPEPIMVINRDFTVAMANRTVWQAMPAMPTDGHCLTCHRLTHNLDHPCSGVEHPCPVVDVLRSRKPMRTEHIHYDGQGRAVHVEIIAAPIFADNGEITQVVESCRDISSRKQTEATLSNQIAFLKTLIETIPSPIFYKDCQGTYLGCNTAFEKVLGLTKAEITGKTAYDIAAKELADRYHAADRALLDNPGTQVYEAQVRYADGSHHEVVFNKATFHDSEGKVGGLVGVMVDVTEAKRTANALQESAERFNAFMENLPALAFIKDQQGRYIYLNQAVTSFYKEPVEQRLGKTDRQLWPAEIADAIIANDQRVLRKGQMLRTEEMVEVDGHRQHHLVVKFPISLDGGRSMLLAGFAVDITDWRAAEKEKEALQARLANRHRLEALGTLAGGIAHDFNNILTAIMGYSELARIKSCDNEVVGNYLSRVLAASKRAKDLVKQILAFSRQSNEQPRPVMVKPIVEEAVKLLGASLPATIGIELELDCEDAIMADPTRLHQIVMNLCANASHAMREHGGVLRINLACVERGPDQLGGKDGIAPGWYVRLSVEDTGCGISSMDLDHIFEPFFSTKRKEEGTGMGLSVVHGIVTACKGAITVASEPGKGTRFDVYLPRIEAGRQRDAEAERPLPTGHERILFVDDEKMQAELARESLSQLGYQVTAFSESASAMQAFLASPEAWDLVITDLTMPGMTGDVLGRKIMSVRPELPVILSTGYSEAFPETRARDGGFSGYLLKPLLLGELARLIRSVLEGKNQPCQAGTLHEPVDRVSQPIPSNRSES